MPKYKAIFNVNILGRILKAQVDRKRKGIVDTCYELQQRKRKILRQHLVGTGTQESTYLNVQCQQFPQS